jgi:CheY-like chemotaxis protein
MDGLELLSSIRQIDGLSRIPFVMLSSSSMDGDMKQAEKLGVDQYRVKPTSLGDLVQLIKQMAVDWGFGNLRHSTPVSRASCG